MLKKLTFLLTKSEKKTLFFIFLGLLLMALMEAFGIGILLPIMDLFMNPDKVHASKVLKRLYKITGAPDNTSFLVIIAVFAIFLFVFKSIYCLIMSYLKLSVIAKLRQRLSTRVLEAYLNKPYEFHVENNSANLIKNILTEVPNFVNGYLELLITTFGEVLIFLGILCLLFWLYPLTTGVLVISLGVFFAIFYFLLKKRIENYAILREKHSGLLQKCVQEPLNSIKEIQVFDAAPIFLEKFSYSVTTYLTSFIRFTAISNSPRYIVEAILFTSLLCIVIGCVYFRIGPSDIVPTMLIFGLASLKMAPALTRIYSSINYFNFYSNSLNIVHEILEDCTDEKTNLASREKEDKLPSRYQFINIDSIGFCYKAASAPIFKDLKLSIPVGQTIAFVGESGAGKSTLVNILMGLLVSSTGSLYYGDIPITASNIKSYRKKIGYVPQEITLIDDTLEANIALGIPCGKIDKEQLDRVIRIALLETLVKELPDGTKTIVGERGVKLSGGQRQRAGIARALYRNPEILILDESTSALDGYADSLINEAIKKLSGSLTIIIVAHRLSTIEYADVVYVLDKGTIVDKGTVDQLIKNSTIFQKIANYKCSVSNVRFTA